MRYKIYYLTSDEQTNMHDYVNFEADINVYHRKGDVLVYKHTRENETYEIIEESRSGILKIVNTTSLGDPENESSLIGRAIPETHTLYNADIFEDTPAIKDEYDYDRKYQYNYIASKQILRAIEA